jgi:hypothetical protein
MAGKEYQKSKRKIIKKKTQKTSKHPKKRKDSEPNNEKQV